MPVKYAHDIRRTVASLMSKNDVAIDEIRRFLGHTDEKTTWGYIYNQDTEETTKKRIDHALSRRTQVNSNQK
jgi:integrase